MAGDVLKLQQRQRRLKPLLLHVPGNPLPPERMQHFGVEAGGRMEVESLKLGTSRNPAMWLMTIAAADDAAATTRYAESRAMLDGTETAEEPGGATRYDNGEALAECVRQVEKMLAARRPKREREA